MPSCQAVNLSMTILIDPFHRNKKRPELNPELFVVSLVFSLNPQSHADGAGFYDAPCSPHLPSICTCILCAPFVECFELKAINEASFLPRRTNIACSSKPKIATYCMSDVAEPHRNAQPFEVCTVLRGYSLASSAPVHRKAKTPCQ